MIAMIHIATGIFIRYFSRSFMEAIITPTARSILSAANPKKPIPKDTTASSISGKLNLLSVIFITLPYNMLLIVASVKVEYIIVFGMLI